jgi:protein-tyrosine-phosphatase
MTAPNSILFLCPHNAAKSLLAVVDFDRMAATRELPFRSNSAGTEPDNGPSPAVVAALRAEGIDMAGYQPRLVTEEDMAGTRRVISMGCNPDDLPPTTAPIERWDDIPPVSRDLEAAREAIRRRLKVLVDRLAAENQQMPGSM